MEFIPNPETVLNDVTPIIASASPTLHALALLPACWLWPVEGMLGLSYVNGEWQD